MHTNKTINDKFSPQKCQEESGLVVDSRYRSDCSGLFSLVTSLPLYRSCPEIQLNSVTWVSVYRKQYIRDWLNVISDISVNRTKVKCEPLHFMWWHIYHWQQDLHLQRNHIHTHRSSYISFHVIILIKIWHFARNGGALNFIAMYWVAKVNS